MTRQTETSNKLTPTGAEDWSPTAAQIEACLAWIDGGVGAEDPRYGERFARIQEEVNQLSGTDFDAIIDESLALLGEEAKDLRVAGFLCLALVARDGVAGLALGFELMDALINTFGSRLYPQRANARDAALRFPLSERVQKLLERASDAGDETARSRLGNAMDSLHQTAVNELSISDLGFRPIRRWLDQQQTRATPDARSPQQTDSQQPAKPSSTPSAAPAQAQPPSDDREHQNAARQLLNYLREQGRWPEHVALARAFRWATLQSPPSEDGRTRIEAPRATAIAAIERACAGERWLEGLEAAEKAFMESGGQFAFSIQRLAAECARGSGYSDIAERIESETRLLRQRLPQLETLAFNDGEPFATEADRDWLERLDNASPSAAATEPETDGGDRLEQARQTLVEDGLHAAVTALDQDAPRAFCRTQALVRLRQARLCLEAERPDTARLLLEGVQEELARAGHDQWDNDLTASVLRVLVRATESDSSQSRNERGHRLRELQRQLAYLDVTTALER